METHGNPIIDWQQNHAKKNHNNLQTFPPNPRRFGEHEPLQENPISVIINLLQSIYIYISCIPLPVFVEDQVAFHGKTHCFPMVLQASSRAQWPGWTFTGLGLGLRKAAKKPARLVIYEETH